MSETNLIEWVDEWSTRAEKSTPPASELADTLGLQQEGLRSPKREVHSVVEQVSQRRLVIGIDYGTTYTAVAYATPVDFHTKLEKIFLVTNWGPGMSNLHKIPSVISFSHSTDGSQQWGSNISPSAISMIHTKLELEISSVSEELEFLRKALDGMHNLQYEYIKASISQPGYPDKTAEQIVTEYLKRVIAVIFRNMIGMGEWFLENVPMDVVLTVPTDWSYHAKNSFFRAFQKALEEAEGQKKLFPKLEDVFLVSEHEAAAIYISRYIQVQYGRQFLKPLECFILMHAGDDYVDGISYQVKRLEPTLELEMIGRPIGRKCGAIYVEQAFKEWLRDLLSDPLRKKNYYRQLDPNADFSEVSSHTTETPSMRALMRGFDALRRRFRNDGESLVLDLPGILANITIEGKVNEGEVTIPNNVMKEFFDRSIVQILRLIDEHIIQIDHADARVLNIFLIGAFTESTYLRAEIEQSCRLRGIHLRQLDDFSHSETAMVRGAVLCGSEKSDHTLDKATACDRSYGISVNQKLFPRLHQNADVEIDPLNYKRRATDHMIWLIKKGDVILRSTPREATHTLSRAFISPDDRSGELTIWSYSSDDNLPDKLRTARTELMSETVLSYDMNSFLESDLAWISMGYDGYYQANLMVKLTLFEDHLDVELSCKGRTLATSTVSTVRQTMVL